MPDVNSGKEWSEMDVEDQKNNLAYGAYAPSTGLCDRVVQAKCVPSGT